MVLCEKLGKTLNELQSAMNPMELRLWIALQNLRTIQETKAREGR
jgi:hypothetical protein